MPSVPRTRSALELPLSPTRQERENRSVLDNTNTCSTISFAHSFRGRRFLLRSLATGFSLAGTFALAKESSCPTPRRAPLRRSFRLLRVSKIPPPTSSSRRHAPLFNSCIVRLDRSQCLRLLTYVSSVLCPPLLPGQTVVLYTRATRVYVQRVRARVRVAATLEVRTVSAYPLS